MNIKSIVAVKEDFEDVRTASVAGNTVQMRVKMSISRKTGQYKVLPVITTNMIDPTNDDVTEGILKQVFEMTRQMVQKAKDERREILEGLGEEGEEEKQGVKVGKRTKQVKMNLTVKKSEENDGGSDDEANTQQATAGDTYLTPEQLAQNMEKEGNLVKQGEPHRALPLQEVTGKKGRKKSPFD